MAFIQSSPGFINQVEPPVLPVSLVKTEVVKNEPPESEIVEITIDDIVNSSDEEIISDIKDIDIVSHSLCEDLIKRETVPTNILETKHSEDLVKTENAFFANIDDITESETLNKTEDTSNGNDQETMEVQGSNALGNLDTDKHLVLNFSNDLSAISSSSRKVKHPEKIDFAQSSKTVETTSWEKDKEKIKVIKAPIIPVEPHEYTSLAKNKHVCNHCQQTSKKLNNLKLHIKKIHRKVTKMYQCPYCPYKSKGSLRNHIILKHKTAKDIQWFQCNLCEMKYKLKPHLPRHMKVHLIDKQVQDRSKLCLVCRKRCTDKKREKRYCSEKCAKKRHLNYRCDKCDYKTFKLQHFNRHKLTHLKPDEIQYLYCYLCSHKNKDKQDLKRHIFRHFRNENVPFHCYSCDFMTLKRDMIIEHFKKHSKDHSKLDEIKYKYQLETSKKREKRYRCDTCDYKTDKCSSWKTHKITHLKPEEIQYFHCHHCSYKSSRKSTLKTHISMHFRNGDVQFHCYICDFMTLKRYLIVEHFKKHPEHRSKCDETNYKYQLKKLEKRYSCDKCNYKFYTRRNLNMHKLIHLKPEESEYFYCYHCSFKSRYKQYLKSHILKHFRNEDVPFHCYICDFVTPKRDLIVEHFKKHSKHHSKCDETKY